MIKQFVRAGLGALLLTGSLACDAEGEAAAKSELAVDSAAEASAEAGVEGEGEGKPASSGAAVVAKAQFDLEHVAYLVRKKKAKDGKSLEKLINAKSEGINKIDLDDDGKIDTVSVVEVRDGGKTKFEIRVLPSTKKKQKKDPEVYVTIAFIELVPVEADNKVEVKVYFTDVVEHDAEDLYSFEFEATFTDDHVEIEDGAFVTWVYEVNRPVFYGAYFYVEVSTVDVHVVEEGCWPPGHCKHGHWKASGSHSVKVKHKYKGGKVKVKHKHKGGKVKVKHKHKGGKGKGKRK